MTTAYINRIATAVPRHDVHRTFVRFAHTLLDRRSGKLFDRMAERAHISHRWSSLAPSADPEGPTLDRDGFYSRGHFPSTAERMRRFETVAPPLAAEAAMRLGVPLDGVTHVIVTTCTGFSAPGLDLELVARCGLDPSVERTVVGFMGCYAAVNALKLARHIVRSEPRSRVLILSVELCTLHLKETDDLDQVLSFLIFGDGAAAALVSADPHGLALERFRAIVIPETADLITWHIRELGFDMVLSGRVPATIGRALGTAIGEILDGRTTESISLWAVHPGGRSVLDAVETALGLGPTALAASQAVLEAYGNMSSPTLLFVLDRLMRDGAAGALGCGLAFGPGLTAETMLFRAAG